MDEIQQKINHKENLQVYEMFRWIKARGVEPNLEMQLNFADHTDGPVILQSPHQSCLSAIWSMDLCHYSWHPEN